MSAHARDIKELKKKAIADGWDVVLTNGGHIRWTHPSGRFFFSAQTPGDYRVVKKIKCRLRNCAEGRPIPR